MPFKVLVYSRFPKAMMARIGERFELIHTAGKPRAEVFTADELSGVQAIITRGRHAAAGGCHGYAAGAARHHLLRHWL